MKIETNYAQTKAIEIKTMNTNTQQEQLNSTPIFVIKNGTLNSIAIPNTCTQKVFQQIFATYINNARTCGVDLNQDQSLKAQYISFEEIEEIIESIVDSKDIIKNSGLKPNLIYSIVHEGTEEQKTLGIYGPAEKFDEPLFKEFLCFNLDENRISVSGRVDCLHDFITDIHEFSHLMLGLDHGWLQTKVNTLLAEHKGFLSAPVEVSNVKGIEVKFTYLVTPLNLNQATVKTVYCSCCGNYDCDCSDEHINNIVQNSIDMGW